ncbi:uncharacterized protein LOC116009691 [Ipomoea triloba]|uniref:uncharacterized protein LOC116009691 n=1 Tax=Ipomoea triloba TaxID=35885 RepID=UPI00125D783B|nr:uncharacterized protein LOC116009691 [Ipomoea triloba]
MSLNRVWVAASVAFVNNHSDQGQKLKSGLRSLNQTKKCFSSSSSSSSSASDLRPLSGSDLGGFVGNGSGEDRIKQADDSLRQVMYFNCWGQG